MGLSITKGTVYTKLEIPLQKGDLINGSSDKLSASEINKWEDNGWLIDHLRHLADYLEETNPRIINIGLKMDCDYKSPKLYVECFERRI